MVHLLAFSLQDQVEKYGAYIGIAAFFGLAVLTILYFSQARELRRLRDWAGRAPERAQEVEARAIAQAEAARRAQAEPAVRRVPAAATAAAGGAAAATAGGGEQATQVVEREDAGQSGNGVAPPAGKPADGEAEAEAEQPGDEAEAPDAGEDASPEDEAPSDGADDEAADDDGERPPATPGTGPDAPPVPASAAATPAGATPGATPPSAGATPDAPSSPGDVTPGATPAPVGANPGDAASPGPKPGAPATPGTPGAVPAPGGDAPNDQSEPGEDAPGNGRPAPEPGEIPVAPVPRATPLPRRSPAPAAPLRQPDRSATLPPRRPAPAAPRRTGAASASPGAPRAALIGVGLGVIVLAVIALLATGVIGGGDDPAPPPNTTASPSAQPTEGATLSPESTKVAVLNGTTIGGLASDAADRLRAAGYGPEDAPDNVTTGNNTDQARADSAVLYGTTSGARTQAREVAQLLEIETIERLDADTRELGENADVVVILGQDKAP